MNEIGASALSSGLSFAANLGGSVAGGLFSANQAKKNRAFQERMYKKQVEDNIKFWNMQNEYNLPSAQIERLRNALPGGLNPLLMYGEGGISGNLAQQQVQSGTAPHGAQGNVGSFNTRLDLANLALVEAQAKDLESSAKLKDAERDEAEERKFGQSIQNEINWRTRDAQVAIKNREINKIDADIEWLYTQDRALDNITAKNLENIASMIEFRQKYYEMDFEKLENQIWYNIESIAIGKAHVSNEIKDLAIKLYDAKTRRSEVMGQLKVFDATVKEINSRKDLTDAQKSHEYLKAYNTLLKNGLFEAAGTENLGGAAGLMLLLTGSMSGRVGSGETLW